MQYLEHTYTKKLYLKFKLMCVLDFIWQPSYVYALTHTHNYEAIRVSGYGYVVSLGEFPRPSFSLVIRPTASLWPFGGLIAWHKTQLASEKGKGFQPVRPLWGP